MGYLLKNALIFQDNALVQRDVLIQDGLIQKVSPKISNTKAKMINLEGKLLSPGLVDLHVHFREPGGEHKETIQSGSLAAAAGGYTEVYAMPNLDPVPDSPKRMKKMHQLNDDAIIKVQQVAPIGKNIDDQELVDFENMESKVFSNDGRGVQTAGKMYEAMQRIAALNGILLAHTEDESLSKEGVAHPNAKAHALGLETFNEASETAQIARDLVLAHKTQCHYHVCHLSSRYSLEMIRYAKTKGVKVSSEVTPHHLLLSQEDIDYHNSNYKMNPPLREKEDRDALLKGLIEGHIECIATDHAPHHVKEKELGFQEAAFGIIASEFAFPLLYTDLVLKDKMPLEILLDRMGNAARRILKQEEIQLQAGNRADLAVFDLNKSRKLEADQLYSKSQNSPFLGKKLKGFCEMTFVEGAIVWQRKSF